MKTKRPFIEMLFLQREEMVNDLEGPYRKTFSPENLSDFSWDKTTSWAEEKAPLTVACLRAMGDQPPPLSTSVHQHSHSLFPSDRLQTLHHHQQPRRLAVQNSCQDPRQEARPGARQTGEAVERRNPGEKTHHFFLEKVFKPQSGFSVKFSPHGPTSVKVTFSKGPSPPCESGLPETLTVVSESPDGGRRSHRETHPSIWSFGDQKQPET